MISPKELTEVLSCQMFEFLNGRSPVLSDDMSGYKGTFLLDPSKAIIGIECRCYVSLSDLAFSEKITSSIEDQMSDSSGQSGDTSVDFGISLQVEFGPFSELSLVIDGLYEDQIALTTTRLDSTSEVSSQCRHLLQGLRKRTLYPA